MPPARTRRWHAALALAALCAGGCAPERPPSDLRTAQAAGQPGHTRPERATEAELRVRASYDMRIKAPPGGRLEIALVDGARTVAATRLEDVAGPPYEAVLRYDPSRLGRSEGQVRARLIGPDGALWFQGETALPSRTGRNEVLQVELQPADAGPAPSAPPPRP